MMVGPGWTKKLVMLWSGIRRSCRASRRCGRLTAADGPSSSEFLAANGHGGAMRMDHAEPFEDKDRPEFFVVCGTNVIEGGESIFRLAERVKRIVEDELGLVLIFKASWDKANRTCKDGFRGIGMEKGLDSLMAIKQDLGLNIITDVHETSQVEFVDKVADVIQIPSFLCRQTDLITRAAETDKIINLKRGQFASATVMGHAVQKVLQTGNEKVMVCERGLMFGMDDLVFDPKQLHALERACGEDTPIIVDITHSCQSPPSSFKGSSGGSRDMIPIVGRAAVASGVDGVFIECHENPENAPVDGGIQWPIEKLDPLLRDLIDIARVPRRV
mmetsp:Transcript_14657/g.25759  ORF Transcript_14657/g.25759 Transcript_14657/m.25759 type:complete len:330 (+) Transcript_14657:28-1017(+)